jgi:hypothetical protein
MKNDLGWQPGGIGAGGGSDPTLTGRVTALENKLLKVYYYAEITGISGTISKPQGATILLDQWANGEDALVCAIVGGKPDFKASTTYVNTFDINGNFTLSGALPSNPAALIYVFEIKRIDFDTYVNNAFIIQYVETDIASEINVAPSKTTPVDADKFGIWDSITGLLNSLSLANIKATLKAYFDTLYYQSFEFAASDESTALTTGTAKITGHWPYSFTMSGIFIGLSVVSSSGNVTIDFNDKNGNTIFSERPAIVATEFTSLTNGTQPALTTTTFVKGDKFTVDIDVAGTGAKGLKVYIKGIKS